MIQTHFINTEFELFNHKTADSKGESLLQLPGKGTLTTYRQGYLVKSLGKGTLSNSLARVPWQFPARVP